MFSLLNIMDFLSLPSSLLITLHAKSCIYVKEKKTISILEELQRKTDALSLLTGDLAESREKSIKKLN